jgi:hypothetical protein
MAANKLGQGTCRSFASMKSRANATWKAAEQRNDTSPPR